ncbi:comEB [Symbiodinium natans]|uniref:ComEB protein n=1 Tax=Symbiodinium natans TaxID=878477 RepID=A0A812TTM7_9DINO|nr:comEB [Symbiodinium natans]
MSGLPCPLRLATRPLPASLKPVVRLPPRTGPFGAFDTFGWRWGPNLTIDENLLRLALVVRFNCLRVANYTSGRCSAIMARPPRQLNETHVDIEVVGFGINAPPRFAPRRVAHETKVPGVRHFFQGAANNEIHSEMQIIGRCAREGIPVRGAWFYIALAPCWDCCKALVAAGAARVLFKGRGRRAPKPMKANSREQLFAEANDMAWVHADFSEEREAYVDAMWDAYKQELGLDRAAVKAQASAEPL